MSRRVEQLTGDTVEDLPTPCSSCLVWELGAACPSPLTESAATAAGVGARAGAGSERGGATTSAPPSEPQLRKQAWVSAQVQDGHPPGRIVRVDGEVAAYALFAPASVFAPRTPPVPWTDPDAVLLATLWVQPHFREHGLGRLLVQSAIKEAIRLHAPAVEAYGDRRWRERGCVLPAPWLLHEGFEVHREHPRFPLLRLDVRRTVRWAESLEHALEEVIGALPRRLPSPVRDGGPIPGPVPERYRASGPDGHHRVARHREDDR